MSEMLKGIAASKGIAIGKAYIFEKVIVEIDEKSITNEEINVEVKKIEKAIDDYKNELSNKVASSEEAQGVIDAHKELVSDPYLIETIISKIENDNKASDFALRETIDEMVTMMAMLDDEYMRERAADYKDIGQQVMYKLKGIKPKTLADLDEEYIVIAEELTPSDTSTMKKDMVLGFANDLGGKTSHTSIIAQTLSIPAIVGMKEVTDKVNEGDMVILDAVEGILYVNPNQELIDEYSRKKELEDEENSRLKDLIDKDAITSDGKEIEVVCNIGNLSDLDLGLENGAKGVGLFRTEFLYMESNEFPSEDKQFEVYKKAAEKLGDYPLLIRTLDIGGDKELPYFEFPKEENPFLGWRALRICFDMEEVFRAQLRAILRASAYGNIKILLPMIISVEEIIKVNKLVDKYKEELKKENIDFNENIDIGIMVETPSSVLVAEDLIEHCDYFSIGTNDLTQYLLAVDRGNEKVSDLYNYYNPAVLRAIKKIIDASHKAGKWTGMCGSMSSDSNATYLLLGMGLDEFSVVGSQISKIKDIIINADSNEAQKFANYILTLKSLSEVEKVLDENRVS